jgi:hypothetical protein
MNKNITNKLSIVLLLICFFCQSSLALTSPDGISPRALGMGQAFTAIADDAFAAYWNPAGFAINPGIDVAGSYQLTNRNRSVGDNAFALKGCLEIGMNPFAWILGVGLVSAMAYDGAKYLAGKGIVKKGWGRQGETIEKSESFAGGVKEEEEKQKAEGKEPARDRISKKEIAKKAVKEVGIATIYVAKKYANLVLKEAVRQTRPYYYDPPWYRPNYYRPNYWDNRYAYDEIEITPYGKAQFALGLTVMSDKNSLPSVDQDTNWYSFSVASGYAEAVAFGANLNIYDIRIPSLDVRGFGAGMDVGGLLRFSDKLMLGLTVKEILTTDVRFENHEVSRYQMKVNAGIAIQPIQNVTLAADVHNFFEQGGQDTTMHYGIEVKPIYGVAIRAGLSDNNKTAGLSFGIGQLIVDYAYLGGAFNRTQLIGASWKI